MAILKKKKKKAEAEAADLVGEGGSGSTVNSKNGADIAGSDVADFLHLVGVHAHKARDLDRLAALRAVEGDAFLEGSLVDSQVGQLAVRTWGVRIKIQPTIFQLECQTNKWLLGI